MEMNYQHMTVDELIDYYKFIKNYLEQGFRVDGIKDELELISKTIQEKTNSIEYDRHISYYLNEIKQYMLTIRH